MSSVFKPYFVAPILLALCLLSQTSLSASPGELYGRWQAAYEGNSDEFAILQFEKGGRVYVEQGVKGDYSVWAAQYTVKTLEKTEEQAEKDLVSIPRFLGDTPVEYQFEEKNLVLHLRGGQRTFRKEAELRHYSRVAWNDDHRVMQVRGLDINVEIFGDRAISHVMYTIRNNHDEDLEAKIEIPLPEDALVVGYAIDIGGRMVEGVAVPKAKARQSFEEIEDRKVDPGIAEITRGNRFSTEIYPVPSKGTRKVRLSYTHSLDKNLIGLHAFEYPLSEIDGNASVTVTMSADGMRFIPQVKKSPFEKPLWEEANTGNRFYFADALPNSFRRIKPFKDLVVRFTPLKQSSAVIARARDGHRYVFARLDVPVEVLQEQQEPTRISILWDASSSAAKNHKNKLKVLAGFIKKIKRLKLENVELQLVVFANEIIHEKVYQLSAKEDALILAKLVKLRYDGATRFDLPTKAAAEFKPDYSLLFSDGISSLGSLAPVAMETPLYVIVDSSEKDLPWLYSSAYGKQGLLLDLDKVGVSKAVQYIGKVLPPLEVRVDGLASDMEMASWMRVSDKIQLTVAARLSEELDAMEQGTLSFSIADQLLYVANFEQRAVGEFARYDWLRLQMNNLLGNLVENEEKITEFGMQYSLATPYTTLMVLENIEDYAVHGIRPPRNFPGAKGYEALRKQILEDLDGAPSRAEILAYLKEEWNVRRDWWEESEAHTLDEVKQKIAEIEKERQEKKKREQAELDASGTQDMGEVEALQRVGDAVEEISVQGARASISPEAQGIQAATEIKAWSPETPYMQRIRAGDPKGKKSDLDLYFKEKQTYGNSSSFYMDVAQFFYSKGEVKTAFRIISNVLELHPEDVMLERMVAYNLEQFKAYDATIAVLEHVKKLNNWEASSARDLARVWEKKAAISKSPKDYQQAIDYYMEAITGPWELEEELRIVALMEFNHLLAKLKTEEMNLPNWEQSLLQSLDLDVRVVLSWNSRVADIDVWVLEPSGQYVSFKASKSIGGGYLPYDITDGFGPEEYMTRFAQKGAYEVFVDMYSNRSVEMFGPVSISLDVYTNYGRENEELRTTTVRLKDEGERIPIGNITWQQ